MAVPKFKNFLKPTLWSFEDKKVHTIAEISEMNAKFFKLNQKDLKELTGKGGDKNKPKYVDRTYWAITYLFHAGLINKELPGTYFISDRGLSVFEENPLDIDIEFLSRYESFRKFKKIGEFKDDSSEDHNKGTGDDGVRPTHYWLISPGENAHKWNEFYTDGIIAIGWNETGNLENYHKKEEIKIKLQEIFGDDSSHKNDVHALWQFANEIRIGDIVFAKKGMSQLIGMGIVESDYEFNKYKDYRHIRKVKWSKRGNWPYDGKLSMKTLTDITNYHDMVRHIQELIGEIEPPRPPIPPYTSEKFLQEVFLDEKDYNILVDLIKNKKNLIVQGPPGVGKTFMAKRLAYSIMGEKDVERVMMVQFHQSYSYEDFVMGYRPSKEGFELRNGSFYEFCKKAEEDSENEYFFIIDEINRGNLSKIFGELFMLIENDKRGEKNKIQLLYSDELFFIPKNVYIIGLMNTADRSLAMIDYALRRRFAFFDLEPGFETKGFEAYAKLLNNVRFNNLIEVIINLNKKIEKDSSLGEGFKIGHSYLCNIKPNDDVEEILKFIIKYELIPLLKEYWFDEENKIKEWKSEFMRVFN